MPTTTSTAGTSRAITQIAIKTESAVNKRNSNRLANMRRLMEEHGGPKALAAKLGYKQSSFVVQMAGPNPTRPITEDTCRKIEEALGLEEGSMDWPPGMTPTPAPVSSATPPDPGSAARDAQIVQMLAAVWSEDRLSLPVLKFGQIAAYAISEASETGRVPSPEALRRLVQLLK